jgi:hypothetical protein
VFVQAEEIGKSAGKVGLIVYDQYVGHSVFLGFFKSRRTWRGSDAGPPANRCQARWWQRLKSLMCSLIVFFADAQPDLAPVELRGLARLERQ